MQTGQGNIRIEALDVGHRGRFFAMASPCEVLLDDHDPALARRITEIVAKETWRIERDYSRYRSDNIIHRIHHANGAPVQVGRELGELLDFADRCYHISDGLFDITSGILRKIWKFDGSANLPTRKQAKALLPFIGWDKVTWSKPYISLPEGMQIDLGGIGKEYAVDRAAFLVAEQTDCPFLVNFGGDIYANKTPNDRPYWQIGIDAVSGPEDKMIPLKAGGVATSGDTNRFLEKDGIRYPHVLNPRTGWAVRHAPSSVTVIADNCIQAGLLSTLAMLKGRHAKAFLDEQDVHYFIQENH